MAVCLGVDADGQGVTLTVKSPSYAQEDGYATLTVSGPDWPRAVAALYAQAPASPQFGQLREVVISQQTFDQIPARQLFSCIDQLPSVRSHALVTVCPGRASVLVEAMKPEIGKRLSKYLDISLQHFETQGCIPATSLSCALRDLSGFWRDPLLAYCDGQGYAGGWGLGSEDGGLFSSEEVQLYRLIRGESQALTLEHQGGVWGVVPRGRAQLRVESSEAGDTLCLRLPVYFTYSLHDQPPAQGPEELLQKKIEALIGHFQRAGCDALGFGCQAVRRYATLGDWLQSGWPQRFRQAAVRVQIDGLMRQQHAL